MSQKLLVILLLFILTLGVGYYFLREKLPEDNSLKTEKGIPLELIYPQPNTEVGCEFELSGKISNQWFFEGSFPVSIVVDGKTVLETQALTEEEWTKEGDISFYSKIKCDSGCVGSGNIVLKKDNPSDLPENDDSFSIPVTFSKTCAVITEDISVKVYFGNSKTDPSALNCEDTYSVTRSIPETLGVGRASLEQLFLGPTADEKTAGYFTSLPEGVSINSLKISNGVAYVDLNEKLNEVAGGSCLVSRVRSQIENTLKQFDTVKSVVISVNGSTEGVLQP